MAALPSRRYGWYALGVLTAVNFLHYGNRNVLFPMYEDLRAAFGFSNSDLGLLGTAFMLSHAAVSLPLGWAGDRYDRRVVIAGGLAVWSLAAVASAAADGFGSMMLARALVGVGTAACVPVANSLLCEIFDEDEKARTVSIFNLGLFLGGAAGFAFGATLGYPLGILVLALPGIALAVLVWRLRVPARRVTDDARASFHGFVVEARALAGIRTLRRLIVGATLMAFAAGGYTAWFFEFLVSVKGFSQETSLAIFGAALVAGLAGVVTGGVVGDALQRRLPYGRLLAMTIGMGLSAPFAAATLFLGPGVLFYLASCVTMFCIVWYHGPMAAAVDDLAPGERATTAQALVIFLMHLVGTAPSSWIVGEIADRHGLKLAMLIPTITLVLAAAAIARAFPTAEGDRARAGTAGAGAL